MLDLGDRLVFLFGDPRTLEDYEPPTRRLGRHPQRRLHPAAEVVRGDLGEPESLTDLLKGVDRMYLFPFPGTAREVVDLAKRAGVWRIVVLSSGSVPR